MKIEYNSPVILTFALIATLILVVEMIFGNLPEITFIMPYFTVFPVVDFANPIWYFRLFSHVLGHGGWEHLVGNFTIILLVGPILEEKYGSKDLFLMILVTALVVGVLQIIFFNQALLGASGVAFMLILLASYTRTRSGGIPLTFILIVLLFLGKEFFHLFKEDQVSQFAHIIGGILGGVFGFFWEGGAKGMKKSENKRAKTKETQLF